MAEQDWLTPATAPEASPYQNAVAIPTFAAPAYELRPLNLGELLDRTFALYRSRFWLFCGIAAIAAAVELVCGGIGRVAVHRFTKEAATIYSADLGVTYLASFIYFFVYSVTQAATCFAMSEVYLNKPTSIGESFRAVVGKWYAWIGISWWQLWSAMWIFMVAFVPLIVIFSLLRMKIGVMGTGLLAFGGFLLLPAGMVYGVIAYIRNSIAVPAKVVEGMTVRRAMRRSKDLVAGAKGRIFVLGLIVMSLHMVAGVVEMPFALMTVAAKSASGVIGEVAVLVITFLAHSVVTPIASIGLCLIYFDQRVRREAFDLEVLLGPEDASALPVLPVAVAEANVPLL